MSYSIGRNTHKMEEPRLQGSVWALSVSDPGPNADTGTSVNRHDHLGLLKFRFERRASGAPIKGFRVHSLDLDSIGEQDECDSDRVIHVDSGNCFGLSVRSVEFIPH